jgi:hypothetical protein
VEKPARFFRLRAFRFQPDCENMKSLGITLRDILFNPLFGYIFVPENQVP